MRGVDRLRFWSLLCITVLALDACGGKAGSPATAVPTATAQAVARAVEGGSAPEVETSAPAQAPAALPAATIVAPSATPPPTAVPPAPTAAPLPATATVIPTATQTPTAAPTATATATPRADGFVPSTDPAPLQIEVMRRQTYPGSAITLEQTLAPGANYTQYVVSYRSDGYKIFALMTIPTGQKPATGWPVIVFNHGYIQPSIYRTTERYVAYVDMIARAGYIVFKSDYRGHGFSEGPTDGGGYGSPGYTNDVLNALASLKVYRDADPNRIGMWGHSMGGSLTLRAMTVVKDIKAGVIWGGVVAPYPDIFGRGATPTRTPSGVTPTPGPTRTPGNSSTATAAAQRGWRQQLETKYGTLAQNPEFWASISPNSYLADINPIQLDHSITDEEVPLAASTLLNQELQAAGRVVEYYTYPGDNHNISANFTLAMTRSIAWFDKYVKGGQ